MIVSKVMEAFTQQVRSRLIISNKKKKKKKKKKGMFASGCHSAMYHLSKVESKFLFSAKRTCCC